ncbi:hypothetical protein ARMGADRAFT_946565, partial [Armillaria gallica]
LGALPLVIGMPVMVTQNFDVESGIVNSATGILKKIHYRVDQDGRCIVLSCTVDILNMSGGPLTGLNNTEAVAL